MGSCGEDVDTSGPQRLLKQMRTPNYCKRHNFLQYLDLYCTANILHCCKEYIANDSSPETLLPAKIFPKFAKYRDRKNKVVYSKNLLSCRRAGLRRLSCTLFSRSSYTFSFKFPSQAHDFNIMIVYRMRTSLRHRFVTLIAPQETKFSDCFIAVL